MNKRRLKNKIPTIVPTKGRGLKAMDRLGDASKESYLGLIGNKGIYSIGIKEGV